MNEEVKRKIQKLLALSKSPNENEAASALEKANALMSENNITQKEMFEDDVVLIKAFILKKDTWMSVLASAISWLYGVYSVHQIGKGWNASERLEFYGLETDAYLASEMYGYLIQTINRMARQNIRKNAKHLYRESYKTGIAKNIASRIFDMGEKVSWAPDRKRKMTALENIINSKDSSITKNTAIKLQTVARAEQKGMSDGVNVHLNRQTAGCCGLMIEGA